MRRGFAPGLWPPVQLSQCYSLAGRPLLEKVIGGQNLSELDIHRTLHRKILLRLRHVELEDQVD